MDGKKKKIVGIVVVILVVCLGIGLAYRLLNAPATSPLPEGVTGFKQIGNELFYVNENGQSYGGSGVVEDANFGAEHQFYTREEKAARLPDLVTVFMDDGRCGKDCNPGYLYKEDFLDCFYYTEEDYESWPEHQEGVDDFIYYTAYDSDGVTELGVFKRINVKLDGCCYLSDGSIYLVMEDYPQYDYQGNLLSEGYSAWIGAKEFYLLNDDEIAVFAAETGTDADELTAERDRQKAEWEESHGYDVAQSVEDPPEDWQSALEQLKAEDEAGN